MSKYRRNEKVRKDANKLAKETKVHEPRPRDEEDIDDALREFYEDTETESGDSGNGEN